MGNRPMKIRCGAPSQRNQRAENDRDPVSPLASESSSSKVQARGQVHCAEVFIVHITSKENEVYILVPPEEMEGERPQENSEQSGEMPSISVTSGSSVVASGISEEADLAPKLADSMTETLVRADVQPVGLDLPCEACQLLLPEKSPGPPPKTCKASSSAEHTSDSSAVSEEEVEAELGPVGTLSVGIDEPWKGTKDVHPSSELSKGTEVPESDPKVSCEMDLEFTTGSVHRAAEEKTTWQRELDEASPEEALRRTTEPQTNLMLAETLDRPSVIMAALANEQLAEGQTHPQNHLSLSVSEREEGIPEESSAVGSLKERDALCSPDEVSPETELQPNDQKVPCRVCLEFTSENIQVAAEEPANVHRQLDDEASLKKAVNMDSALEETSDGTSSRETAPEMKQLAEEQSIPGYYLPLAAIEMEGKMSGDCFVAENMGEVTKAVSSQLKILPVEAQDKMLVQVEARNETASSIASNSPLEKEQEQTLTAQNLSTVEEKPSSNVQLLGEAEFLDAAQPDGTRSNLGATLPGVLTPIQAGPPAELTMVQPSPKTLLRIAETIKELEEASPDQPPPEETLGQAGNPEAPLPPEPAPLSGTPLGAAQEEEDAEFFDGTATCEAAEGQAWASILEAQDKHDSKEASMQGSPVGSPKLITEEEETRVFTDADCVEVSKVEDSSLHLSGPRCKFGPSAP